MLMLAINVNVFALLSLCFPSSISPFHRLASCPEPYGIFAHPQHCNQFINCWQNKPYVQTCAGNLFFNSTTKQCDFRNNVVCKDFSWEIACGQNQPLILTSPSQVIMSESNGGVYRPNLNCSWLISAPLRQEIDLKFLRVDVENSKNCSNDRIDVYDEEMSEKHKIHSLCGKNENVFQATSSANKLYVTFSSNSENEFQGFQFMFQFIRRNRVKMNSGRNDPDCSDATHLNETRGVISSPGYDETNKSSTYPPNSLQRWKITAPEGHFINLHFVLMDIEKSHTCGLDALVLFKTCSIVEENIIEYFCGNNLPNDFKTFSNEIVLFFISDGYRNFRGFVIEYEVLPESKRCGANELMCANVNKKCLSNEYRCNGFSNCQNEIDEVNCIVPKTALRECGIPAVPSTTNRGRIVGGRVSEHGNWPWQGALSIVYQPWLFKCGAIVIHPEWILTAAHCFKHNSDARRWALQVGKHNLTAREDSAHERSLDKIIIHPNFGDKSSPFRGENDIALVHVRRPLEYTDYVIPVCLPQPFEPIETNTKIHVTGFGTTGEATGGGLLKQVELPVIEQNVCNAIHQNTLSDSMFCAGVPEGGHDSCQGDSGGPAVVNELGRWKLLGIVSWGDKCAVENKPGVYTKVSHFIPWIEATTGVQFASSLV